MGTVWEVSCNLYKTFFDDRLTLSLYAKPYRKGRTVTVDNGLYRSMRRTMTKEEYLSLTLRFNFGSGKMKPRHAARSTQTYQKIEKTL